MTENNTTFDDSEGSIYSGKGMSFREIMLNHVNNIIRYASVEFRGGYWLEKMNNSGVTTNVYVADTREVYSNAVEVLADILCPHYDEDMINAEKEINAEKDELNKELADNKENMSKDEIKQEFREKNRRINKKLFRKLSLFMQRKNYLEIGAIED